MKKVLTIAGSDSIGGAGIQADIKTITVHGMYAMSVITALTAQNTMGVYGIQEATAPFVAEQMDAVFQDIRPDSVKIGMVSSVEIIKVISEKLKEYKAENIVLDPVMVATSGGTLIKDGSVKALISYLMPLATVITPNMPEAEVLSEMQIKDKEDMSVAARKIAKIVNCNILIKGGHMEDSADDLLFMPGKGETWLPGEHIDNPNTHGTGCTLSSAIACGLSSGLSVEESVSRAKEFISGAIGAMLDIGKGRGPLYHMYNLKNSVDL